MRIGKILDSFFEKSVLIIKILGLGSRDVRTLKNVTQFGIDSNIGTNYKVLYSETGVSGEAVVIGIINTRAIAQKGETHIYSEKDNQDSFRIKLLTDGTCEIGGNDNYMVKFNELKTEFNKLKTNFNNHITEYNTHLHIGVTTGAGVSGIPSVLSSNANSSNIDNCKNSNIKSI
jgi:hypothetical protein